MEEEREREVGGCIKCLLSGLGLSTHSSSTDIEGQYLQTTLDMHKHTHTHM